MHTVFGGFVFAVVFFFTKKLRNVGLEKSGWYVFCVFDWQKFGPNILFTFYKGKMNQVRHF